MAPFRTCRKIDRVFTRRQRDECKSLALQRSQVARPFWDTRVRRTQYAAHRRANRLAVQRIAARLVQYHARAERGGVAKRASDVIRISHRLEHEQQIGG